MAAGREVGLSAELGGGCDDGDDASAIAEDGTGAGSGSGSGT
jgi:hypothetical protein